MHICIFVYVFTIAVIVYVIIHEGIIKHHNTWHEKYSFAHVFRGEQVKERLISEVDKVNIEERLTRLIAGHTTSSRPSSLTGSPYLNVGGIKASDHKVSKHVRAHSFSSEVTVSISDGQPPHKPASTEIPLSTISSDIETETALLKGGLQSDTGDLVSEVTAASPTSSAASAPATLLISQTPVPFVPTSTRDTVVSAPVLPLLHSVPAVTVDPMAPIASPSTISLEKQAGESPPPIAPSVSAQDGVIASNEFDTGHLSGFLPHPHPSAFHVPQQIVAATASSAVDARISYPASISHGDAVVGKEMGGSGIANCMSEISEAEEATRSEATIKIGDSIVESGASAPVLVAQGQVLSVDAAAVRAQSSSLPPSLMSAEHLSPMYTSETPDSVLLSDSPPISALAPGSPPASAPPIISLTYGAPATSTATSPPSILPTLQSSKSYMMDTEISAQAQVGQDVISSVDTAGFGENSVSATAPIPETNSVAGTEASAAGSGSMNAVDSSSNSPLSAVPPFMLSNSSSANYNTLGAPYAPVPCTSQYSAHPSGSAGQSFARTSSPLFTGSRQGSGDTGSSLLELKDLPKLLQMASDGVQILQQQQSQLLSLEGVAGTADMKAYVEHACL